ncbi:MAG: YpmA family protein [Limnochordales bacterium]
MGDARPPGQEAAAGPGRAAPAGRPQQLQVIGSESLALQGDVHRLVTFLNQCLKDEGLIFGLTRVDDGRYRLTVYRG